MNGFDHFKIQITEVSSFFPKLHEITLDNGITIVQGELDIIDSNGKLWETYQIEIHPIEQFPYKFPLVYEVGGKIPRIGDWHIYEDTHSCCIAVEPEEHLICRNGITLTDFVQGHVLPYFFNQTHRKIEGYYKNGEFSHGIKGIYEYYDEILGTKGDVRETIRLILLIADISSPGRTHDCFCGRREKFRRCHRNAYDRLYPLGKMVLYHHANLFYSNFNSIVECLGMSTL